MADEFANKIKRLELENFTCFGKVAMDFSPGINVFIGENGTGKTHLLKVLYGILLTDKEYKNDETGDFYKDYDGQFFNKLWINWNALFNPNKLNSLVRQPFDFFNVKYFFNEHHYSLKFKNEKNSINFSRNLSAEFGFGIKSLYIPISEMLSWGKGFISLYTNNEIGFDKSYYELALALDKPLKRGEAITDVNKLKAGIEEAIGATIQRKEDGGFYLKFKENNAEFEAPLVATGINKLAQLIYLIMNGSLTKDTILFWDEPEAGLNPKYIKPVAQFLLTLANAGCQIFVATHDYLLPYELSLSKEYEGAVKSKVPPMKFFTLMKGDNGTVVESGETMYDLPYDAIMEGHLQFHEKREQLQRDSLNQ